jgi:hypothetical protein
MAPAPGAHVIRNALITLEGTEYANQVTKARFVPDTPIQVQRTMVPDGAVTDIDSTVWTLELSGLQIHGTGGLAKALTDAAGTEVEIVVQPKAGVGQEVATATVVALPVEFGGEQGSFRLMELELPVVGVPEFSTSA